jgi:hypothetical protein
MPGLLDVRRFIWPVVVDLSVWPLLGADDQGLSCGFDDLWGDGGELVDLQDAADLAHESFDEPGSCRR